LIGLKGEEGKQIAGIFVTATRFDIFEFVMSLFGRLQYGKL
jgi:hypothetical protein